MSTKNFLQWSHMQSKLDARDCRNLYFYEREVWWCSLGCNIGDEQDGKSEVFTRPVLVFKKFNKNLFYGLPLSTTIKENPYYLPIMFQSKFQSVLLSHMRLLDSRRLWNKIGMLPQQDFHMVQFAIKEMFSK